MTNFEPANPPIDEYPDAERRVRHDLRAHFAEACRITAPFFDAEQSWAGQSTTMYARQTLRDAYPELSQQETALLFSAVQRFHRASQNK